MFFRKYLSNRPVEDVFLPGDDELYRPIIKRIQSREYFMKRPRDWEDNYNEVFRMMVARSWSTKHTSNNEEAG